jgi:carbonic anhydrase/acetyltransferase-like protein (isoleucine patch superfamily)
MLSQSRSPEFVSELGNLRAEWAAIERLRSVYASQSLRIHRDVLVQNWASERFAVGANVSIEKGTMLCWGNDEIGCGVIEFGSGTWVGQYNNFRVTGTATIQIGANCLISQFCSFIANNHGMALGLPIHEQAHEARKQGISVGDDVWFGAGSTVLPGVTIAPGSVIAAGAVVNSDIGANEIWAGVPARRVGMRR